MTECTYTEDIFHGKACGKPAAHRGYTIKPSGYYDHRGEWMYDGGRAELIPIFLCDHHHEVSQRAMAECLKRVDALIATFPKAGDHHGQAK